MKKPIAFFVHHQGRGHANRTMAVAAEFARDRPVSVLTAGPHLFDGFSRDIEIVTLPNMIGAAVPTPRLYAEPTPPVMHCVPLGLAEMRRTMRQILDHLDERAVGLFVVDVSAEIAMLARIASVPAVQIRMHGDRNDIAHIGAYEACVGMLAPSTSGWSRTTTRRICGIRPSIAAGSAPASIACRIAPRRGPGSARPAARDRRRGHRRRGSGTPYAPLTVAARAAPDALWLTLGPTHREGHETDFANLRELGWVPSVTDYLAAADIVVASAGDNTVHEVARVAGRLIVMPEWRYFGEQTRKAEALVRLGAAVQAPHWPGDFHGWRELLDRARSLDGTILRSLYAPDAATRAAGWLEGLTDALWQGGSAVQEPDATPLRVVAAG